MHTRQSMIRSLVLALAISGVPAVAATTQPADLPVRTVTLYTSGVGFFRHDGRVTGDGSVTLKFKTAQINDVLKSLVVQDTGGRVSGVQYPSQDPLDKTLKTFQIDLTGDPSVAAILSQLRGAKVTINSAGESRSGTVVGVEKRTIAATPTSPARETAVLNLFDGNGLLQEELDGHQTIKLEDPNLAAELGRALASVAAGRDQDKKPVTIAFTGGGEHRLSLGYVVETPVWKTAYRLLMKDQIVTIGNTPATLPAAADYLQGWAIVENQTDADWNDVTLSLVSGRPISFVMDLYQPQYLQRPVVQLEMFKGLQPQVYYDGVVNERFAKGGAGGGGARSRALAPAAARPMTAGRESLAESAPAEADADAGMGNNLFGGGSDVQTAALTAKLGELFEYRIDHVSLPRQQSSLVPIVTDKVELEAMSIYNETVLPRNPLNGVMLTNSTGKLLPQGPVTVLSGGAYAGDARIEDLPAGQKRLLSFGIDLETTVDAKSDGAYRLVGGTIVRGVLMLSRKHSQTKTFTVQNKGQRDKTLIIEHPFNVGWGLVDTPEPLETTDRFYRFKLPIGKGDIKPLKITQEQVESVEFAILDADVDGLIFQSRQGALPEKVRDALVDAVARRQALVDLERQSKEKAEAATAIGNEQSRLRENMKVVDKAGQYYTRLLTKLNEQESQIETLQKERDVIDAKAKTAREAFETYLAGLNVG